LNGGTLPLCASKAKVMGSMIAEVIINSLRLGKCMALTTCVSVIDETQLDDLVLYDLDKFMQSLVVSQCSCWSRCI
jgi:hypothetical protein